MSTAMLSRLQIGPADHDLSITEEDFDSAEFEEGFLYEIIEGKVYVSPLPNYPEAYLESWMLQKLFGYSAQHPGVISWISNKTRVYVRGKKKPTVPEPDISCYTDPMPDVPLREIRWWDMSPIIVAEILVDNDPKKDLVRNVDLYFQVPSIAEYWVLDGRDNPDQPTLIARKRSGKKWIVTTVPYAGTYTTSTLPDFQLLIDPRR